jgi:lipopolysaccharide/colanic/teichoic acid biosynthesis glycosyltransferase
MTSALRKMGTSERVTAPVQTHEVSCSQAGGFTSATVIYRFEPFLGAALSLLALPVLLVSGGAIFVFSGRRSPFIAHERVGFDGIPFRMWKLRTMWPDSIPEGRSWKLVEPIVDADIPEDKSMAPDARVNHRFSSFCRKYSIDELPQFFHVAMGQMSLVGPRPITRKELDQQYGPRAEEVLRLRPGLTGLWQVSGRNVLSYEERCQMDLAVVRGFSLKLYASILLRTIPKLISGTGSF